MDKCLPRMSRDGPNNIPNFGVYFSEIKPRTLNHPRFICIICKGSERVKGGVDRTSVDSVGLPSQGVSLSQKPESESRPGRSSPGWVLGIRFDF